MKKILFIITWLIVSPFFVSAQPFVGADLTYKNIGGNDYVFTVTYYRNCSSTNPFLGNVADINFKSIACGLDFTVQAPQVPGTGEEITGICPAQITACNTDTLYSIQEYVYTTSVITLSACSDWVVSFAEIHYCRSNLASTIATCAQSFIPVTLNNASVQTNSPLQFLNKPHAVVCQGQTFCFNHGASDPDGDSLSYELVAPMTSPATTVWYLQGYSAQQPLKSNPPVTLDPHTGTICMTPDTLGYPIIAIKVKEWRKINGTWVNIGSVVRDFMFQVIPCQNNIPVISGIDTTSTQYDSNSNLYSIKWCYGKPVTFKIFGHDNDTAPTPDTLTMSWDEAIPAATMAFTGNGTPDPYATFNWDPTIDDINKTHSFTVTIKDPSCPYRGLQTLGYNITIQDAPLINIGPDTVLGIGSSMTLSVDSGYQDYKWSTGQTTPAILVEASNLSPGVNKIWVQATNDAGCTASDTILVTISGIGTSEFEQSHQLKVYPNPASEELIVEWYNDGEKTILELITPFGKIILNIEIPAENDLQVQKKKALDVQKLPQGFYLLRVSNKKGYVVKKVFIN